MRPLAAIPVLLLGALALGAEDPRWLASLDAGKREARAARKPILCVIVREGESDSRKLLRSFTRNREIAALSQSFVLVKLDRSRAADLVNKYDLRLSPSTLVLTAGGMPLRSIVGPFPDKTYLAQMEEALEKYRSIWKPKRRTPRPAPTEEEPPGEAPVRSRDHPEGCPDACPHCGPAIERALGWLSRRQARDGRWRKPPEETVTRDERGRRLTRSIDHVDVALTSMAGLAFLASGSTPDEGPHRRVLARAVEFVEGAVREDGIVCRERGNDWLYLVYSTFETSLGGMFLAAVQQASPDLERAKLICRVADHLQRIQDPRSGAWGYSYDFREFSPYTQRGWRLLATSHCAMTALCWMREAGAEVSEEVLDRGARYLLACRGRDGAFVYRTDHRRQKGYPGATAGALYALSRSGAAPEEVLAPIRARYRAHYRDIAAYGQWWWWFLFYTALEMNDRGEGAVADFDACFRDRVLDRQEPDGSFPDPDETGGGAVYATAVAAIALQIGTGRLPIASERPPAPGLDLVEKPRYLTPPQPLSRVKVFEHGGRYLVDLIVSVEGPADGDYLDRLANSLLRANCILFDVTDGQMCMHRVEILADGEKADVADIRVTKDFRHDEELPFGGAHGYTRVSKRTEVKGGREREGRRIGDWVKLPYSGGPSGVPIPWDRRRFVRVIAHELMHYLFGAQDEYDRGTGRPYCDCLVGDLRRTELCRPGSHTDDRYESCWELAKGLYPKLEIPETPDPGPWLPPSPRVEVSR